MSKGKNRKNRPLPELQDGAPTTSTGIHTPQNSILFENLLSWSYQVQTLHQPPGGGKKYTHYFLGEILEFFSPPQCQQAPFITAETRPDTRGTPSLQKLQGGVYHPLTLHCVSKSVVYSRLQELVSPSLLFRRPLPPPFLLGGRRLRLPCLPLRMKPRNSGRRGGRGGRGGGGEGGEVGTSSRPPLSSQWDQLRDSCRREVCGEVNTYIQYHVT